MGVLLFSYGTLQLANVQRMVFGRLVPMEDDALVGFEAVEIIITDQTVLEASGTERHLALVPATGSPAIPGKALHIADTDFPALDAYEGDNYRRIETVLASGRAAWVYVKA